MRDEQDVFLPLTSGDAVADRSFGHDREGILHALDLALRPYDGPSLDPDDLPTTLPPSDRRSSTFFAAR